MPNVSPPLGFSQRVAVRAINLYRNMFGISMLHQCRFLPSCSIYAEQAICAKGLPRGAWQTAKRLLRCHPFCEGGADPI